MKPTPPIRVTRAPVLTLWATMVADRLGHPPETALTLGRFVVGTSVRAEARRLGVSDEKQDAEERHARAAELKPRRQTMERCVRRMTASPHRPRACSPTSRGLSGTVWPRPVPPWRHLRRRSQPRNLTASGSGCMNDSGRTCRRARRGGGRRGIAG